MAVVNLEPTQEHPVPLNKGDETTGSFLEEMAVAGNTAEAQRAMGAIMCGDNLTKTQLNTRFTAAMAGQNREALQHPMVAIATAEFLREYGSQLAIDVGAMRTALTNKLIEIANCGDMKYELKALEMLGKHSDIGLFTDRSEVTINYKDPESLEAAIKDRVKRLLNANIIDVTPTNPTTVDFEDELGSPELDEIKKDLHAEAKARRAEQEAKVALVKAEVAARKAGKK